jgi:hypothetical protein
MNQTPTNNESTSDEQQIKIETKSNRQRIKIRPGMNQTPTNNESKPEQQRIGIGPPTNQNRRKNESDSDQQ